jgi:hypothetical protein
MTTMLENDLAQNISRAGPLPLPAPAKGRISLRVKSFPTLSERVEDSFLLRGAALQHNKAQIAMETELLEILGGQIRPNHRSTSGLIDS